MQWSDSVLTARDGSMVSGALGKISRLCPPPLSDGPSDDGFQLTFFCFKIYLFNKWITTRYTEELASNNFGWGPRNSRSNGVVEYCKVNWLQWKVCTSKSTQSKTVIILVGQVIIPNYNETSVHIMTAISAMLLNTDLCCICQCH